MPSESGNAHFTAEQTFQLARQYISTALLECLAGRAAHILCLSNVRKTLSVILSSGRMTDVPLAVVIPATMGKKGEVPLVEVSMGATPRDGLDRSKAPPVSFLRLFRYASSLLKLLSSAASTNTYHAPCALAVVAPP
jgi:hypothetical protein